MRQKRAKAYKKLMNLYCMSFGFRQPYQVLVDAEMCSEAVSSKIDLAKQLATVLQGSVKPMITQCCIHALYLSGREAQPAVDLAKNFERRRCNHRVEADGKMKDPEECLADVVGDRNKHRYVIAAQSQAIRQRLRQIPSVPLVHVKRSVMVLEPISEATERAKSDLEEGRLGPSKAEATAIAAVASSSKQAIESELVKKKRKGPKGPNPLSVKKKKVKDEGGGPKAKARANSDGAERGPRVGEKRKREDEGEKKPLDKRRGVGGHASEPSEGRQEDGATEGGHRKRRRRRKNAPDSDTKGVGAVTTSLADAGDK